MISEDNYTQDELREQAHIYAAHDFLELIYNKITRRVIAKLKKYNDAKLSGEFSGLDSFWDEYCVQIQGEHSFAFDIYETTVENFLLEELNKETKEVRNIYYSFAEFEDDDYPCFVLYDNDTNTKEFSYNCPINVSVYPLKRKIDHIAANFTNRRITNYLEI